MFWPSSDSFNSTSKLYPFEELSFKPNFKWGWYSLISTLIKPSIHSKQKIKLKPNCWLFSTWRLFKNFLMDPWRPLTIQRQQNLRLLQDYKKKTQSQLPNNFKDNFKDHLKATQFYSAWHYSTQVLFHNIFTTCCWLVYNFFPIFFQLVQDLFIWALFLHDLFTICS